MSLIEKEVITEIASQLDKPIAYVYETVVVAQPVLAQIFMLQIGIGIIAFLSIMACTYLIAKRLCEADSDERGICALVALFVSAILTAITVKITGEILVRLWLPEYAAIGEIAAWMGAVI